MKKRELGLYEREYRSVSTVIGFSLLLFLLLANSLPLVVSVFTLFEGLLGADIYYTVSSLLQMAVYFVIFFLPFLLIRLILKRKGLLLPTSFEMRLGEGGWILLPIGVLLNLCASYINSFMMSVFGEIPESYSQLLDETATYEPYQMLLMFMSTAILPAVCEELLFRGAVLSNLLPYGKGAAIAGSAMLFGLMHQNPYQLFCATVTGLILGYAYVKSGSIWLPTAIHFTVNTLAIAQEIVYVNMSESAAAIVNSTINLVVLFVGIVSLIGYLVLDVRLKKDRLAEGSFGKLIEPQRLYQRKPIEARRRVKLFLAPTIIVFVLIAAIGSLMSAGLISLLGLLE